MIGDFSHNPLISAPMLTLTGILGVAGIILFVLGMKNWFLQLNGEIAWKITFKFSIFLLMLSGFLLFIYM